MLVGIIGDTHDQIPELKKTLQALRGEGIELLIHAGDWVSAFTLEYYRGVSCPIRGVWGNNVGDTRFPAMAAKAGIDLALSETHENVYCGRRVFVAHEPETQPPPGVDLHVYGHNHAAKIEHRGATLSVNPGTLLCETFPWLTSRPSFAIYDTDSGDAHLVYLDTL